MAGSPGNRAQGDYVAEVKVPDTSSRVVARRRSEAHQDRCATTVVDFDVPAHRGTSRCAVTDGVSAQPIASKVASSASRRLRIRNV